MRPFDRDIEFQFALRNVTDRALVIADLRAACMIHSTREVDIVMARSAGGRGRLVKVCLRLCRSRGLLMARLASADIRRKYDRGVIVDGSVVSDDLIRLSGLHARKRRSHVDLVGHYFQVQSVPGIRVDCLWLMAHYASFHPAAGTTVK